MNYYHHIPEDIFNFCLYKFLFIKCDKCNKIIHYTNIIRNCKIFTYKSVFDDDYGFDEQIQSFNYICKDCIKSYSKRYVINTENNFFKWVNKL